MRAPSLSLCLVSIALLAPACSTGDADVEDGETDSFSGKADSLIDGSAEANGVLALVNDVSVDFAELDVDAGLSSRVAANIIDHRNGADATAGTSDDNRYDNLKELDDIPYVGTATLGQLVTYATAKGLVHTAPHIDVIFSPQPIATTHSARIADMINHAQHSIDIAMYSYSDAGIGTALTAAVGRGIKVRFLFDTAAEDRKLTDLAALTATKSGKLESSGVDVRWVNKILHHKFILIDGPRDDASRAATARLVTGSANWSSGGATVYDENTLFIDGSAELNSLYQTEFDLMWNHSKDFALATPITQERSTTTLTSPPDDPGLEAYFTSANMTVGATSTTFSTPYQNIKMASTLVAAIGRAQTSIHIAEGHMRMRPVAEALIAAHQAHPSLDIKVYLDEQEYISSSGDASQKSDLAACLVTAGSDARKQWDCKARDFLFSKALIDAGIDVRYKAFGYRWDASYAIQMHSKYILIDGKDLYTGSYNLSMNSEQDTFENVVHLSGTQYAGVLAAYEQNFSTMRETGRTEGLLAQLRQTIATAPVIPLVFAPVSVTWQELTDLKTLIRANCPAVDSTDFRNNPAAHRTCTRP